MYVCIYEGSSIIFHFISFYIEIAGNLLDGRFSNLKGKTRQVDFFKIFYTPKMYKKMHKNLRKINNTKWPTEFIIRYS